MVAFEESHRLWKEPVALEFSFTDGGDGPWHGDMTPFGDEDKILPPFGNLCGDTAGGLGPGATWPIRMIKEMMVTGMTVNAYSTVVEQLKTNDGVDCWLGQLVATGIAPQLTSYIYAHYGTTSPALDALSPRIKYWLDSFRTFGAAVESSIRELHIDSIYFIGLEGGSDRSVPHFSVYVGNTAIATVPPLPENSTLLICQSLGIPFANMSLPGNQELEIFAASNVTVFMSGAFWSLNNSNMMETLTKFEGGREWRSSQLVFPSKVTGAMTHSVTLAVRERVRYSVSASMKTDDGF
jgi:hypothetical protein